MKSRLRSLYLVEITTLLQLTIPIIVAQVSQTAMGVVDTIMAGWAGKNDLAAVAVGSSIFFPFFLFQIGLLSAVVPLVSQARGKGDEREMHTAIQQGCIIGLFSGVLLMLLVNCMAPVLEWMQVSPEIIPLTRQYLFAISWGFPVAGLFFALRNGGDGASLPRLSMIAGFVGLAVNITTNYILIFGKLGFPRLGGVGCGWASAISILAMCITMYALLQRHPRTSFKKCGIKYGRLFNRGILTQLKLGMPLGISLFIECSLFAVIALLVSRFGATVVSAHQVALNFTSLLFMLPYSLSSALAVQVGFTIGRKRSGRLLRTVQTGLGLAFCGALCTATCIVAGNHAIAALYTENTAVRSLAATLLLYAAVFQIPDALQVNCAGALRGCKDTKIPMLLTILAYWCVGLPVGCSLGLNGFGIFTPGPEGFWVGLICGLLCAAILLGRRLALIIKQREHLIHLNP
ncbi:MATE family efflux transporter [Desulfogranum japonicum]|uniref:MATE family efflux transporter n=1 Tax=Desulfogranum japonicum TaxID=231447 RepID=UPI000408BFA3|nr:MATE family efflux transporter [Desulfogranum japonicum]